MYGEKPGKKPVIREYTHHWKGALTGVTLFVLLWGFVFFCAFMIAFGNETSLSGAALRVADIFFIVANPLWGIPISLVLGALVFDPA